MRYHIISLFIVISSVIADLSLLPSSFYLYSDFDVFLEGSGLFDDPVIPEDPAGEPPLPPAPVLKDLDSFSDGTGLGSFDYSLTSDHGIADRRPTSLAFSPAHPEESVVLWRNDVHRCTVTGTAAELEREGLPEEHPEVRIIPLIGGNILSQRFPHVLLLLVGAGNQAPALVQRLLLGHSTAAYGPTA